MSPSTQNLTFKWLAGVLLAIVLAVGTAWASNLQDRQSANEKLILDQARQLSAIEATLRSVDQRTARIERKLDAESE